MRVELDAQLRGCFIAMHRSVGRFRFVCEICILFRLSKLPPSAPNAVVSDTFFGTVRERLIGAFFCVREYVPAVLKEKVAR